MVDTHRVLVIGPDSGLLAELRAAAKVLENSSIAIEHEAEAANGLERASNGPPRLVMIDDGLGEDVLERLTGELREARFQGQAVVAFRPELAGLTEGSSVWLKLVRNDVRDFLRRPVSSADLERLLTRGQEGTAADVGATATSTGRVLLLASNKGGVGKTTLAVNLAVVLARREPDQVLLLDASLQLGTCAGQLDLDDDICLTDVIRESERLDPTLLRSLVRVHSSGLHVLPAPRNAVEASEVNEIALARAISIARRTYKWVIIDTFPMLDEVAMAALDLCDRVFVVTSGSVPTVRGVGGYLDLLSRVGVPTDRIRVLWNRSRPSFAGSLKGDDLEETLGRPADHVVPFSKGFMIGADQGVPLVLSSSRLSRGRRAIERIAKGVLADFEPGSKL